MNILILGGGGFIGLSIAEALLTRGDAVTIADRTAPPDGAIDALDALGRLPGRLDVATGDVRDVASAAVTLLDAEKPRHRLYHISSGISWSALDFAERLTRDVPSLDARLVRGDERLTIDLFGTTVRAPLSIARLREEFGWAPRFSALEDALADYRAWQRAHPTYWAAATR